MKTEIVSRLGPSRLPEVGQHFTMWRTPDAVVYERMDDTFGARAMGLPRPREGAFYAAYSGRVYEIKRTDGNITILQPVGGVMKFEEVQ